MSNSRSIATMQHGMVRDTIRDLGGTMPESLPTPEMSIRQIERAPKKLIGEKSPDPKAD